MVYDEDTAALIKKNNEFSERQDKIESDIEALKKGVFEIISTISSDEYDSDQATKDFRDIVGDVKNKKEEKPEIYYKKQVRGLYLIVKEGSDCENPETMISRKYVMEKLDMILADGIIFHPVIQNILDKAEMQGKI